eukprot:15460613-Alexandrium_andersonii.AAC.1
MSCHQARPFARWPRGRSKPRARPSRRGGQCACNAERPGSASRRSGSSISLTALASPSRQSVAPSVQRGARRRD